MKFGGVSGMAIQGQGRLSTKHLNATVLRGNNHKLGHRSPPELSRSLLPAESYRRRLDCDTTLPAKVFVTGAELGLSKARDARLSVWAPVWAELPAWRSAEPASDF